MKIKDITTPEPHCINPDATLVKATERMKLFDIGILPIRENDPLAGRGTIATLP
jgi:CBS domain-containing protein